MNWLKAIWSNDWVRRIVHTLWQAAGGALITALLAAHSSADVKVAVTAAGAAALSALKGLVVAWWTTNA